MHSSARFIRSFGTCILAIALPVLFALGSTACNPNSIGRPCINPNMSAATNPQISSPALECPSRLCLIQPPGADSMDGNSRNTCTAECSSNDDCDAETKDKCASGFACAIAIDVGNFCCKKLCVCKADLVVGYNVTSDDPVTAQIMTPFACDPIANPKATTASCKNIPAP